MTELLQTTLILLLLLQVKHLFADFFMQTPRMLANRSVYLHMGRAQHAAVHVVLSFVAFLVVGVPLGFALWVCAFEWVVHFHIDFAKGWYSDKTGHTPGDAGFWRAFGADQFLHQATYVAMLWLWAVYAA